MEYTQLHFGDRASWRAWLEENSESMRELWLVFYKKHTGVPTISYDAAVEEALCFGWIDSLIKRLDEDRFVRKFTPRSNKSKWSELNLRRVAKLKAAGLMKPAGLAKFDPDVSHASISHRGPLEVPPYFLDALGQDVEAANFFHLLAPSYQRHFVLWVDSAKREETRLRRLAEALSLLRNKQKLGMR
ncbi:MAG: hypothetical protein GY906_13245 [bacterium]|nr:hypothetical protein [bacterium]